MNTVFLRLSAHAPINALPRISVYPSFHNAKKTPPPPPPLKYAPTSSLIFLSSRDTRKTCFYWHVWTMEHTGLHVRKLEVAAIIFKSLLVVINALEMFTGKLDLDCSSSLIAFETKLLFFPLLTGRFHFFQHVISHLCFQSIQISFWCFSEMKWCIIKGN